MDLVDWTQVRGDRAARLLGILGFDPLELALKLHSRGEATSETPIREQLAKLVGLLGATDPSAYATLVGNVERDRDMRARVVRNRTLGLRIQQCVERAFDQAGFHVHVRDHGYDFEAYERGDADLDGDLIRLEVEAYLVEVKATRTTEAKMTPTQARYATQNPDRYILCVVNLGSIDPSRDLETLTDAEVEGLLKLVPTIGRLVAPVYQSVASAPTADVTSSTRTRSDTASASGHGRTALG